MALVDGLIPQMITKRSHPKVEGASKSHLAGEQIILEHKTKALNAGFYKKGSPVEDKMHDVKGQYEKRLKEWTTYWARRKEPRGP